MNRLKKAKIALVIILAVMLLSSFLASLVQTSGFSVKTVELKMRPIRASCTTRTASPQR